MLAVCGVCVQGPHLVEDVESRRRSDPFPRVDPRVNEDSRGRVIVSDLTEKYDVFCCHCAKRKDQNLNLQSTVPRCVTQLTLSLPKPRRRS